MKKKKITFIFALLIITINISGCIKETQSDNGTINSEIPINVYVDDDYDRNTSGWGFNHFNSIQDGIINVSVNGTVYVNNGIYYENIVINKSINISGEDKEKTVIKGNKQGNVVNILNNSCTIQNMNISNGGDNSGVRIVSRRNTLINNTLYDNYYGIWIDSNSDNTISNNIFSNNFNAIRLKGVSDSMITKNQIESNTLEGINLETCLRITIKDNIFENSGIAISGPIISWDSHIIENNKVNDKLIYYYKNENGIAVPEDAIQIICVNCSNIEIKNINFEKVLIGIQICFSSGFTIENNYFEFNYKNSMYMYHSNNNTIINNNIKNGKGINLLNSENNIIRQNTIENTETGIDLDNSDNNNISVNSIFNNENGIYSSYGHKNNIYENDIFSNTEYGIYLLSNSNNNLITKNRLYENEIAIRIKGSRYNNFITNEINDNSDIGLYICCGASENVIYKNSFINNDRHVDYTIFNINHFYENGFGNYWDDYFDRYPNATQTNGIWDTPYQILGSNAEDIYPLVNPININ